MLLPGELLERHPRPTLETEVDSYLRAVLGPLHTHRVGALTARLGLAGDAPVTLDAAAQPCGVTRERVRQWQNDFMTLHRGNRPGMPVLDQVLELIGLQLPTTPAELEDSLRVAGLTALTWKIASLRAVADLFDRNPDLDAGAGLVGTAAQIRAAQAVVNDARRISNRNGAVHLDEIRRGRSAHLPGDAAAPILAASPGMHALGEGWYWADHPPGRNRLVNVSLRVLRVQQPQTTSALHGGLDRNYTWRSSSGRGEPPVLPPAAILASFYRSHPSFDLIGEDRVMASEELDDDILGPEKLALVGVLRQQAHPAMSRNDLIAACAEIGMSRATTGVYLTYAECLTRVGPNVWGIRGVDIPDDYVRKLQRDADRVSREFDTQRVEGRTPDGVLWFAQRISAAFLNSGVLPNTWHRAVLADRRLRITDGIDEEDIGVLRFSGGFSHGYNRILRKHNARVGDVVRVTIDLVATCTVVELGGEELLGAPPDLGTHHRPVMPLR